MREETEMDRAQSIILLCLVIVDVFFLFYFSDK